MLALDIPPSKPDAFFWTDFAEINAVCHEDQCFSRGDLKGIANRGKDRGASFDPEVRWKEIVAFLENRVVCFGDSYPFYVSEDQDTIFLNSEKTPARSCYLDLLFASGMRHMKKDEVSKVGRFFEEFCYHAFSELMPKGVEIRATWAGGGKEAVYQGTLHDKMKALAKDIRCTANFEEKDFKERDRGDGGIDLIAWHPMYDNREGLPIAFAQCGCSKDNWTFKQLEASPSKHYRNLPVMHRWSTYYFMPLDLRDSDGDWAYKSDIGEAIIVDRLRLLKIATDNKILDRLPEFPVNPKY